MRPLALASIVVLTLFMTSCGGGGSSSPQSQELLVTVTPSSATVTTTKSKSFSATVSKDSSSQGVTWELSGTGCNGAGCGSLSNVTPATVTYTAPSTPPLPARVSLKATAVANSTKSAAARVNVYMPGTISVSVVPSATSSDLGGGTTQLTAAVSNDPDNAGVKWAVVTTGCFILITNSCGAVSPMATASGVPTTYTAPSTIFAGPGGADIKVQATSVTDPSVYASATVHLNCVQPNQCVP